MNTAANKQQNILRRSMAILVSMWLVFGVILSAFFISAEYDHDCTGDECPICQIITVCENFVKNAGTALAVVTALFAVIFAAVRALVKECDELLVDTLITRKVRLNN